MLAALRGTLKQAWRLGYIDAETYQRAVDVGNVSAKTLLSGRALDADELKRLFASCARDGPIFVPVDQTGRFGSAECAASRSPMSCVRFAM